MTRSLALLSLLATVPVRAADPPKRPNVLFLIVDDLRPQLGCYGQAQMVTPNIDRLAANGVRFDRAYCMVPTCGASRASFFTGVRPAPHRFTSAQTWASKDAPGVVPLHTHLKAHGYHTVSNGKVIHHPEDHVEGWSEPPYRDKGVRDYQDDDSKTTLKDNERGRGPAFESADVTDDAYPDGKLAAKAVADLGRLKSQDKPFFLAVGFHKPHLPFLAPKKYWDLYPADQVRLPATYHRPEAAPDEAIHTFGELRGYAGIPKTGPLTHDQARTLIRGYQACVSYTDAQVGKVLAELTRLGMDESTTVILFADHGWNLGEHTLWCKHCCFETSMRVPLIVRRPGVPGGTVTRGLTELIDLYPSLCELTGVPPPTHLEGRSFVPLLTDPGRSWKESAVGRFKDGDTIRTDRFRFTEYRGSGGKPAARMLYDHAADPGEDRNVADAPANAAAARELAARLNREKGKDAPAR